MHIAWLSNDRCQHIPLSSALLKQHCKVVIKIELISDIPINLDSFVKFCTCTNVSQCYIEESQDSCIWFNQATAAMNKWDTKSVDSVIMPQVIFKGIWVHFWVQKFICWLKKIELFEYKSANTQHPESQHSLHCQNNVFSGQIFILIFLFIHLGW